MNQANQFSQDKKDDIYNFKTDGNTFGAQNNNSKPSDIGSGLGSGFPGFGGPKLDTGKDKATKNDPLKIGSFAMDNQKDDSGSDYEEDFELGESIANLGDK
jgi:hypothetical protein